MDSGVEVLMPSRILKMVSSSSDQRSELATLRKTLEEQLQKIGELNGRRAAYWYSNEGRSP